MQPCPHAEEIGYRVQKSVFEVVCNPSQRLGLEANLRDIIDPDADSIRIYQLDGGTFGQARHLGAAVEPPHQGRLIV
ncbi:CRISPR-associated endonuclease Cas2 [Amycolatopsis speibonae]|uniref:CRISPR-associated endonuclease Cas2 n=1 Tax=Amycolatopsis speibonae TaxID=1450224 RepID=A0ABV7NY83_9PSEU